MVENMEYKTKDFAMKVMEEYKKLNPDGKVFINVREKRDVRRSIINDYMEIWVLSPQEKQIIQNMLYKRSITNEQTKSKRPHQRLSRMVENLNGDVSTRVAINTIKTQKTKKKNMKKKANMKKNKRFMLSEKTKEEIKEFLEKKGIKIGVGITVLALMGVIASNTLNQRAENIQIFNENYTSVEEVKEDIEEIIKYEITKAVENSDKKISKVDDIRIYEESKHLGRRRIYRIFNYRN